MSCVILEFRFAVTNRVHEFAEVAKSLRGKYLK